jgi:hypothetical protein
MKNKELITSILGETKASEFIVNVSKVKGYIGIDIGILSLVDNV